MRLALLVLIGACGGGPSAPPGDGDDRPPPLPPDGGPPIPDGTTEPDGGPPPIPDGGPQPVAGGRLSFSWELQLVGDYSAINAAQVEILSVNLANGDRTTKRFPCMVGVGATDQLAAGPYTIQISLFDDLESLQTLPLEDLTIHSGDEVSLGLRVFSF